MNCHVSNLNFFSEISSSTFGEWWLFNRAPRKKQEPFIVPTFAAKLFNLTAKLLISLTNQGKDGAFPPFLVAPEHERA